MQIMLNTPDGIGNLVDKKYTDIHIGCPFRLSGKHGWLIKTNESLKIEYKTLVNGSFVSVKVQLNEDTLVLCNE